MTDARIHHPLSISRRTIRDFSVSMVSIDSPSEKFLRLCQLSCFEATIKIRSGLPTLRSPPSPAPDLPGAAARFLLLFRRHCSPQQYFCDSGELASQMKSRILSVPSLTRRLCLEKDCKWLRTIDELGKLGRDKHV